MKLIFLDIDGVLNPHDYDPKRESCTIIREKSEILNRITDATGAGIVISSAWRYMIHGGAMTFDGFAYLLKTHGIRGKVLGFTRKDEDCISCGLMNSDGVLTCSNCSVPCTRGLQVADWRNARPEHRNDAYVILDDLDLGFHGMPFVQTDGNGGLTDADADAAIRILAGAS